MIRLLNNLCKHSFILCTICHTQGCTEPGVYPVRFKAGKGMHWIEGEPISWCCCTHCGQYRKVNQGWRKSVHRNSIQTPHTCGGGGIRPSTLTLSIYLSIYLYSLHHLIYWVARNLESVPGD